MTTPYKSTMIAASLMLAIATTAVMAQSAPAKPGVKSAPKPAGKAEAKPPAKTLSGQAGGGKLMSRDELRACMKRQDDVNQAARDVQTQRAQLARDREDLQASAEALKTDRAEVDRLRAVVRAWEDKNRAFAIEVESFNKRSAEAQDAAPWRQVELANQLKEDRERLQKTRDALAAEEAQVVPAYQNYAKAFNERANQRDAKVADWNQRSSAAVDASVQQQEAHALWRNECANRNYLEDDETAIKAGK